MNRSLYAITEELDYILQFLEQEDVSEEQKQAAVDEWLDGAKDELQNKLDDYCAVIADRTAWAEARKKEAQMLAAMAKSDENIAARLKDRAKAFFERAGIDKMKTLHFAPRVQANGGVLPLMLKEEVLNDPTILPKRFQKVTITPDMEAIRAALEEGDEVPAMFAAGEDIGAAWLGERGSHFRVR